MNKFYDPKERLKYISKRCERCWEALMLYVNELQPIGLPVEDKEAYSIVIKQIFSLKGLVQKLITDLGRAELFECYDKEMPRPDFTENVLLKVEEGLKKLNTAFKEFDRKAFNCLARKKSDAVLVVYKMYTLDIVSFSCAAFKSRSMHSMESFSKVPNVLKIRSAVYLIGGKCAGKPASKAVYKTYTYESTPNFIRLSDMLLGRYHTGTVSLVGKYIYAISGKRFDEVREQTISLKECERYGIEEDEWTFISPVNVAVGRALVCTFKERYIYKFGGEKENMQNTNTLEIYDVLDDSKGWTMCPISRRIRPAQCGSACQISDRDILLFREKITYIVNSNDSNKVSKVKEFSQQFWESNICVYQHRIYTMLAHFGLYRRIHCYNLITHQHTSYLPTSLNN